MKVQYAIFMAIITGFIILEGCTPIKQNQLVGRVALDSPTNLNPGVNKVSFFSQGNRVVGNVFVPPDYETGQLLPALIIVAPESGIKEQSPGIYALEMSKRGYLSLAFDHRSFGESEGEPRLLEDPFMKIEDIKTAVSYIRSMNMVVREKVGVIGICAGAGYSVAAAAFDSRIKAIAATSGIFDLTDFRPNIRNPSAVEYFYDLLQLAGDGRQKYFETGVADYSTSAFYGEEPEGERTLSAYYEGDEKREQWAKLFWKRAKDYYSDPDRGRLKNWKDERLNSALDSRFTLNASPLVHLLSPRPILFIKGSKSISGYATDVAYNKAQDPKEIITVDGANHFDLYDNRVYLKPVFDKLHTFFSESFN